MAAQQSTLLALRPERLMSGHNPMGVFDRRQEGTMNYLRKAVSINLSALLALFLGIPFALRAQTGAAASQPANAAGQLKFPSKIQYVWIILMENHNWTGNNAGASFGDPDIKGNPLAPYINGWLLYHAAHAEQYFNPPRNHPSAPNYIWLTAGTNFGFFADNTPAQDNITSNAQLFHLLTQAGISWMNYAEEDFGNPEYDDCPLDFSEVDVNHVPAVYFADDTNDFNSQSPFCIAHVRPYSQMATDIADHHVAHYNFISPSLCHDGHEGISPCDDQEPADNTLRSDQWLKENVPLITDSPEYKKAGLLVIVWDEAEDTAQFSDGPIGFFILSPFAKGGGVTRSSQIPSTTTTARR
jgi:phosphatidylinositol-3-phosphatase